MTVSESPERLNIEIVRSWLQRLALYSYLHPTKVYVGLTRPPAKNHDGAGTMPRENPS